MVDKEIYKESACAQFRWQILCSTHRLDNSARDRINWRSGVDGEGAESVDWRGRARRRFDRLLGHCRILVLERTKIAS